MRHIRIRMASWVAPVTAVCFVIGGLLALQFTTQRKAGLPPRGGRSDALAEMLAYSQNQIDKQEEEIKQLRAQLNEYLEASTQREELFGLLKNQLTDYQIALGLVEVRGPGIVMSLDDSELAAQAKENREPFLVHDYDLWPVVNELRAAGAEAISVNRQRVVGNTAIRCAGAVLKINDVPVASPFVIKAIGDPDALAGALNIPGGIVEQFRASKFPVRVEIQKEITIEAVGVSPKLHHAQPVPLEK
ncbi:MAG: DUF881 domain-containing protein [Armatimonadota bacterium]|nr:MAG: DUF881 domain-containing protein [Armatimonadota bacterium]